MAFGCPGFEGGGSSGQQKSTREQGPYVGPRLSKRAEAEKTECHRDLKEHGQHPEVTRGPGSSRGTRRDRVRATIVAKKANLPHKQPAAFGHVGNRARCGVREDLERKPKLGLDEKAPEGNAGRSVGCDR